MIETTMLNAAGAEDFTALKGRGALPAGGVDVIDGYNANPASMAAALAMLAGARAAASRS